MGWWVFTEDNKGRWGISGPYISEPSAKDYADDSLGVTYMRHYPTEDRGEAKRYFRQERIRIKKDLGQGYKNVSNKPTGEVI